MFASMNQVIADLHSVDYAARGARGFRPAGQLHGAADRALEPAIPRLGDRKQPAMDRADRLAAGASAARGRAGDRPWRLPHGQSRLPQDRAAGHRRARLGIVDDRRPARRFRLPLPDLAGDAGAVPRPGRRRFRRARHPRRGRLRRRNIAAHTGRGPIANWEFYLVYSLFRLAAILQGIAKRAIDGTAASADAVATGACATRWASRPGSWRARWAREGGAGISLVAGK